MYISPLKSEEKIDIWNNKTKKQSIENKKKLKTEDPQKLNFDTIKKIDTSQNIKVENSLLVEKIQDSKVYGIYDPADNDFNLNMWSSTNSEDIKASLKRLEKIKLSKTGNQILERILLSFSYAPRGMTEDEFSDMKINFLIKNRRSDLIESFLKQNEDFKSKDNKI